MDLVHGTGKKHRNTGGISRIFAEAMRQIGGVYGGRAINQRFPKLFIEFALFMYAFCPCFDNARTVISLLVYSVWSISEYRIGAGYSV
jgi:hypothetical protein